MTPGGRISAAIEILDEIIAGSPAERALTRWTRASRFAGSKDRAAIRDHVFDALRKRRSSLWASGAGEESGRALILGLLILQGVDPAAVFDGDGHAPAPLDPEEISRFRPDLKDAPRGARVDLPENLAAILEEDLGPDLERSMSVQRDRAPVDLRVNTLKSDRETARRLLAVEGIDAQPLEDVPTALRVSGDARKLAQCRAYRYGFVELQDAASQHVSLKAAPRPGSNVLDLCAGGGGKSLALGALMQGQGRLWAYDINPRRMKDIPERARRAGVAIDLVDDAAIDRAKGAFDLVLVDAPCSGSGSWRRDPANKWRLKPGDISRLNRTQDEVLNRAVGLLREGGTLVYTTCSILKRENRGRVDALLELHPGLSLAEEVSLFPGDIGDGFYFAKIRGRGL